MNGAKIQFLLDDEDEDEESHLLNLRSHESDPTCEDESPSSQVRNGVPFMSPYDSLIPSINSSLLLSFPFGSTDIGPFAGYTIDCYIKSLIDQKFSIFITSLNTFNSKTRFDRFSSIHFHFYFLNTKFSFFMSLQS